MTSNSSQFLCAVAAMLVAVALVPQARAQGPSPQEMINIWPGTAPGTEDWKGTEFDAPFTQPDGQKIRIVSNVSVPTLTVVRPQAGTANGTAVIVCPGGGFQALAFDIEGTLMAQWLADRGITAFVLKYRVRLANSHLPADARHDPEGFEKGLRALDPRRRIAVADATQAIRYLRANAAEFGIAPDRIGLMGFSAGAMTTMGVVMNSTPEERPNFAAPIYGAMEDKAPPKDAPPLFIAAAQDDSTVPVGKSIVIFSHWTAANLPAELHLYETGGHGFGIVKHNKATDNWAYAFDAWLTTHGWAGKVVR